MPESKLIMPSFAMKPRSAEEAVATMKRNILTDVGMVDWFRCFPDDVLVVKFIRNEVNIGAGGTLIAPKETQNEDKWQGKVGLVIKLGTEAYKDSDTARFYGFKAEVGEWAVYHASEGWDFDYLVPGTTNRVPCRLLKDIQVRGVVPRPDLIY